MGWVKRLAILVLLLAVPTFNEPLATSHQQQQQQNTHSHHHGPMGTRNDNKGIPKQILENWASNFGSQLFQFGVSVTKYNDLQARFSTAPDADVRPINLQTLIMEMVEEINANLKEKVDAVRKIMNWVEEKALEYYERTPESRQKPPETYYSSKKLNDEKNKNPEKAALKMYHNVSLILNQHFKNFVNTSFSSVHVPTSIFEKKDDLLEAIGWSANMDQMTFVPNYNHNPTLSYQYFGSATGFLRHYPAMKWPNTNKDVLNPDLYDCRTRPWYVQAANFPKNMFILHDVSGSMTGIRREIAKHVVNSLLDTLTENDYVNVYNFSDTTTPVVPCFKNRLVQANLENVRELKVGLEQDHTAGIANFTSALNVAFDILEKARTEKDSANCNQAIMIVTDGAPFFFDEIFEARQNREHYVRVFTYLVGREVTEKREVLQMACANMGYFTHVSSLSEVQEKVLKYMPVMARPMVIEKLHLETWTPVYAHIAASPIRSRRTYWLLRFRSKDTRQTDWSWLDHNARKQFKRSKRYKEFLQLFYTGAFESEGLEEEDEDEMRRKVEQFLDFQSEEQLDAPLPCVPKVTTTTSKRFFQHHNKRKKRRLRRNVMMISGGGPASSPPPPSKVGSTTNSDDHDEMLDTNDTTTTTTTPSQFDDDSPLALPISEKKLKARLKKVHGAKQDHMEEHFPTPVRPKDPHEPFEFIISTSTPVFDNRNSTIKYEKVRVNASHTIEKPVEERIAILLGVAGTDIPVKELRKMASPFKLGVNGYAFMVNNNGYVVFHPDWRPVFNGELLKPNYNTVDLTEVELVDNDNGTFRNNDSLLLQMREDMIEETHGYRRNLRVRTHMDNFTEDAVDDVVKDQVFVPFYKLKVIKVGQDFRRVSIREQAYEFHKLRNTPYTLAITVPMNAHTFIGEMEIRLMHQQHNENVLSYFDKPNEPRKWKINPDWSYCDFVKGGEKHDFLSKEDLLLYFLKQITSESTSSWAWRNTGIGIPNRNKYRHQGHQANPGARENRWHSDEEVYECEKELVQSLVFDANVTKIFNEVNLWKFDKNAKELLKMYGVTSAFVATRTGLTRWMDFTTKEDNVGANSNTSPEETTRFIDANSGATNEVWYRRAVDRYQYDPESFVYTIPFDAGTRNDSKVTATRAIFVRKDAMEAPVAVVGVQFRHSKWANQFFEITNKGSLDSRSQANEAKWTCGNGEYDCFVLDDNGFILVSERQEDTGRFFGEVDGMVMNMLVCSDVYRKVRVVDYQAVCLQAVAKTNFASYLSTPLSHLTSLFNWFVAHVAWMLLQLNLHSLFNPDFASVLASMSAETTPHLVVEEEVGYALPAYIDLASINKTRLRPCDKETFLYTYGGSYNTHNFSYHGLLTKCGHSGCDGYFNVHFIPRTNLILVVTDGKCRCGLNSTTIKQREVQYNNVFNNLDEGQEEVQVEDDEDDLIGGSPLEVCRTPKPSLHRKRPAACKHYNAEEEYLREDCGHAPRSSRVSVYVILGSVLALFFL